jgi:hypothetical protein
VYTAVILQPFKRKGSSVDSFYVQDFSGQVWVVLAIITFAGVVAILHCIATGIRHATQVHDLRQKCNRLRQEQIVKLQEIADRAAFEPVEEKIQPGRKAA